MNSWTAGYTADIAYTAGFYRELTPLMLELAALSRLALTTPVTGPFAMAELGCGRGFSANVMAAANPHARFFANDFNPTHVTEARALASAGGAKNIHFSDASFAEFIDDPEIPPLDIIALHGILSWVNLENRRHIAAFVRRHLKPGGLVYVSYNSLPGWAQAAPMRRLMADFGATQATGSLTKLDRALGFIGKLKEANARYFTANTAVGDRFDKLKGQNRNYLVHEYLNDEWSLFYHSDVVDLFSEAKTSFLCSAHLLDHVDALNLTEAQRKLLDEIDAPALRETTRDFIVNQQFRRDIFIKGAVQIGLPDARERWLDTRYALSVHRASMPMKVAGALGEAGLQEDVYLPFIDALANGPKTLRDLQADKSIAALGWARVMQALLVLVGSGHVQPCLDEKGDSKRRESTRKFNRAVMDRARHSADFQALASPVTGGGVGVDRIEQLFLLARLQKAPDVPNFVWQVLSSIGQRLTREGAPIESPEDNLKELGVRYGNFTEKRLPVLERLGVA